MYIEFGNLKYEVRGLSNWKSLDFKNDKVENKLLILWLINLFFYKLLVFLKDYIFFIVWLIYIF